MSPNPKEKQEAFEQEIMRYLDDGFRFAYSLTGSREEAEDLAQETFLRAYRAFYQFTSGTNAKAWLFTIMRNLWREKGRKRQKEMSVTLDENNLQERLEDLRSADSDPEQAILDKFDSEDLVELLQKVPDPFRECLILCDLEGYAYAQVSSLLKVKEGTVKSRLFRARQILKKVVLEETNNEL